MDPLSCQVAIQKPGTKIIIYPLICQNFDQVFVIRAHIAPIFQAVCAKVENGEPCCDWVGEDGSGHFVKMVHNGIEYGDMQLICEAYHIMKDVLGMTHDEMAEKFDEWNKVNLKFQSMVELGKPHRVTLPFWGHYHFSFHKDNTFVDFLRFQPNRPPYSWNETITWLLAKFIQTKIKFWPQGYFFVCPCQGSRSTRPASECERAES